MLYRLLRGERVAQTLRAGSGFPIFPGSIAALAGLWAGGRVPIQFLFYCIEPEEPITGPQPKIPRFLQDETRIPKECSPGATNF
jgi:hypothetical protein